MKTIFKLGLATMKATVAREFKAGDSFNFNQTSCIVESTQLEGDTRIVTLVEASNDTAETHSVHHRRRRSRKAFAGAEGF